MPMLMRSATPIRVSTDDRQSFSSTSSGISSHALRAITGDNLAEIPSAKEMIEGIGAVLTPVLSYLGSIKTDTLKDKLKIPSLPQCKMDTVNCEKSTEIQMKIPRTVTYVNDEDSIDNSIENSQQVANQSIQSNLLNLFNQFDLLYIL